jgi:hypothetical protein
MSCHVRLLCTYQLHILSNIHMLTRSPNGLFHPLFTGYLPAYTWFAFTQTNTWQYISIRMPTALTTR